MSFSNLRGLSAAATTLPVLLALALFAAACTSTPPSTPPTSTPTPVPLAGSFEARYDTGSVPPPFNYSQVVEGTFEPGGLAIHYALTYNFRDSLTPAEIVDQGYSGNDDIDWSTRLTGKDYDDWRALVLATAMGPIPPQLPGADSFTVTLKPEGNPPENGLPANRQAWETLISALDAKARTETNNPRSEP